MRFLPAACHAEDVAPNSNRHTFAPDIRSSKSSCNSLGRESASNARITRITNPSPFVSLFLQRRRLLFEIVLIDLRMEIYDDKLGIPILFADILRRKVVVKIYKMKDTRNRVATIHQEESQLRMLG